MTGRRPTRLPRWHEWAIYILFVVLLLTGLAWLALDQWVRVTGEFGPERHPAEHAALIVHGIAAYVFLMAAGALVPVHIKQGWSVGRNKASGLTVASLLGLLALSALGLYYLGGDVARNTTSIVHWAIGIGALPALLVHALGGRRGPAKKRR